MVLADAEDVEPDLFGEDRFLDAGRACAGRG